MTRGTYAVKLPDRPDIFNPPDEGAIRKIAARSEDFPAPVRPTTPTLSPGWILKLTPFSTAGPSSSYHRQRSDATISPSLSHCCGLLSRSAFFPARERPRFFAAASGTRVYREEHTRTCIIGHFRDSLTLSLSHTHTNTAPTQSNAAVRKCANTTNQQHDSEWHFATS